jgi:hypothetical protein
MEIGLRRLNRRVSRYSYDRQIVQLLAGQLHFSIRLHRCVTKRVKFTKSKWCLLRLQPLKVYGTAFRAARTHFCAGNENDCVATPSFLPYLIKSGSLQ